MLWEGQRALLPSDHPWQQEEENRKKKTNKLHSWGRARDPSWTQTVKGLLQPRHCRIPWKTSLPRHNAPCQPKTEIKTEQRPSPSHLLWRGQQVSSDKSQRLIARGDVFSEGQVQRESWSWGWTDIEKTLWKQFKRPDKTNCSTLYNGLPRWRWW